MGEYYRVLLLVEKYVYITIPFICKQLVSYLDLMDCCEKISNIILIRNEMVSTVLLSLDFTRGLDFFDSFLSVPYCSTCFIC